MLNLLARNWWMIALRGLGAVLFGLAVLLLPGITMDMLILLFGTYVLLDGVLTIAVAIANRVEDCPRPVLFEGITGVITGIVIMVWPNITGFVLLSLIATWALLTGIFEILEAIETRQEIKDEWFLILSGVASLIFGLLVALWPETGALEIIQLIAPYAIIIGILLLLLGFRLRDMSKRIESRISWGSRNV